MLLIDIPARSDSYDLHHRGVVPVDKPVAPTDANGTKSTQLSFQLLTRHTPHRDVANELLAGGFGVIREIANSLLRLFGDPDLFGRRIPTHRRISAITSELLTEDLFEAHGFPLRKLVESSPNALERGGVR